jgi:hypothetical protein
MRTMKAMIPGHPAPDLRLATDEGPFLLSHQCPEHFTMLVFYRGLHCSLCREYLQELNHDAEDFARAGVEPIAISMDDAARARLTRQDWELDDLRLGHGLTEQQAREWELFVSRGINNKEPPVFSEPGLFLVGKSAANRPGVIHFASIGSMPRCRPKLREVLELVRFIVKNEYPPRGEKIVESLPTNAPSPCVV